MLTIGSVALSLASGLAILLALLFVQRISRTNIRDRLLGFSLLVMTLVVLTTLIEPPSPILSLAYSILAVFVVVSLIFHFSMESHRLLLRLAQAFTILAIVSIFYFKLVPQLEYLMGVPLSYARPLEVFLLGEAATLIAALMISTGYLMQSRAGAISKKALVWASLIAGGFIIFYVTSSWLLSIIAMWTLGFTMFLPFPLYAIVMFVFVYTVAASWSRSESWIAMGLLLLLFAGRLAQLGYLSMLMVIGLALISFPEAFGFTMGKTTASS